jgi:hypothetical protein
VALVVRSWPRRRATRCTTDRNLKTRCNELAISLVLELPNPSEENLHDQSAIPRFTHRLEKNCLSLQILPTKELLPKSSTVGNASLITAQSSTKNHMGERTPEMPPTKSGDRCCIARKGHPHE